VSRKAKLGVAVAFLAFVGVLVYSSLGLGEVKMEVCIEFKGRTGCGTAAAPTEAEALRVAADNACALIASGMTDSIACARTEPKSVRRLD
jgi:hypothetical protein